MAKAPLPGFSKTRLIPALGKEGAAYLARRLLDYTVEQVTAAKPEKIVFYCAPDCGHEIFQAVAVHQNVQLRQQPKGDLGRRMREAFQQHLPHEQGVIMLGTDAPAINAELLQQASVHLHGSDLVLLPAFDGGYALIGMKQYYPELFEDIPWSTDQVLALTQNKAQKLQLRVVELPPVADIDEQGDLQYLPAEWGY